MDDAYACLQEARAELEAAIAAIDAFIAERSAVGKQHRTAASLCVKSAQRIRHALEVEEEEPERTPERRRQTRDAPAQPPETGRRRATRRVREDQAVNDESNEDLQNDGGARPRRKKTDEGSAVKKSRRKERDELVTPKPGKLKSGGAARGPGQELVFYSPNTKRQSVVDCEVYGSSASRSFQRASLSPLSFDELDKAEQKWVCLKLCEVIQDSIQLPFVRDPFQNFQRSSILLNSGRVLLNDGGNVKQRRNEDLFLYLRGLQRLAVNAGTCRKSLCYMIAAKLSAELKETLQHGEFSAVFDARLEQVREIYELTDVSVATLKRYIPAGRLMLQCQSLAFVNITLLVEQHKVFEEILQDQELRTRLISPPQFETSLEKLVVFDNVANEFSFNKNETPADFAPAVQEESIVKRLNGLMDKLCDAAASDELKSFPVGQLFAIDFAKILKMDFANQFSEPLNVGFVDASHVQCYMNLVNASLSPASGTCVLDPTAPLVDLSHLEWLAVTISSCCVGAIFHFRKRSIVVYLYDKALSKHVARTQVESTRCTWKFVYVDGFTEEQKTSCLGLLHFLSFVVRKRDESESTPPVDLLRLQIAAELHEGKLGGSLLGRIAHEQPRHLSFSIPECERDLNPSLLMHTGFVIVRRFFSMQHMHDACEQFISIVRDADQLQPIFQSSGSVNDKKRLQVAVDALPLAENLLAAELVDVIQRRLAESVRRRQIWNMVALLSRAGCGPQRSHTDYTHHDLVDVADDDLPLGVIVGIQPNTLFDAWPGARKWQHSRFYEHAQVILGVGDALFFLGDAVHAGAAFIEENCRIHAYLESRQQHHNREPDRTRFVDAAAGVPTILPRSVKF